MNPESHVQRLGFDVFGMTMRVERRAGQWHLMRVSADGKFNPVRDVRIPDELEEAELCRFLDDLFHEFATADKPEVIQL